MFSEDAVSVSSGQDYSEEENYQLNSDISVIKKVTFEDVEREMQQQRNINILPYCKFINTKAGVFIADDCMQSAEFIKPINGVAYQLETQTYNEKNEPLMVPGILCDRPRMIILRRTALLRYDKEKQKVDALWLKPRDDVLKPRVQAIKKYLVMFVDEENKFLHKKPIQLTLKGYALLEFDKQYQNFCNGDMNKFYRKQTLKKKFIKNIKEREEDDWSNALYVFTPEFRSERRGEAKKSMACITSGYSKINETNFQDFLLNESERDELAMIFKLNSEWARRYNSFYDTSTLESVQSEDIKINIQEIDV